LSVRVEAGKPEVAAVAVAVKLATTSGPATRR
jgi:hypothetical protein